LADRGRQRSHGPLRQAMGDEAIDSDLVASGPGEDHPPGAMLMLCAVILLAGATEGTLTGRTGAKHRCP